MLGPCVGRCDPCAFQGSIAFEPKLIPPALLEAAQDDKTFVQPNGCNECPTPGDQPAWVAPGDYCSLTCAPLSKSRPDYCNDPSTSVSPPTFCDNPEWANDYKPSDHLKSCLSVKQRNHLWETGHCHDVNTTLPYVAKEGLLFCTVDDGCS